MAKKKKEEVPYSQLSNDELSKKLSSTTESLFKLRFRAVSAPLKNPMEIRSLKREIARLNTFINQKAATVDSGASTKRGNGR